MKDGKVGFLIGGYAETGKPGIMAAVLDESEQILGVQPVCSELKDPSWLLLHPNGRTLYAVEETMPEGSVARLHLETDGWTLAERMRTESGPCHLCMDEKQEFLFVSNYQAGSLGVFRLDPDGKITELTDMIRHKGYGLDPKRQEGPHVHSILCIGDLIYTADLGLDCIVVYRLDRAEGTLREEGRIVFEPGAGPRHMVQVPGHPDNLYAVGELSGNVYRIDLNTHTCMEKWRIFPDDDGRKLRASSIKVDGDVLYIGCRKCNAVVFFDVSPDGNLRDQVIYHHIQDIPRDVWMNSNWCITADQESGGLTLLRRKGKLLKQVAFTETPGVRPTCIVPLQEDC